MNTDALLTLLVALCCIAALGVSATTLDSSMDTQPSDVIHVDYSDIPLGKGQVDSLKRQAEGRGDLGTGGTRETSATAAGGGSDGGEARADGGRPTEAADSTDGSAAARSGGATDGSEGSSTDPSTDGLLALLRSLLLPALALVTAAVLYYYRDRLLAALGALGGDPGPPDPEPSAGARREGYGVGPTNAVYRAWLEMAGLAGVDDPESLTPGECARVAVRCGLDPEAVRALTREFEAVRYGNASVTAERERRARELREGLGRPSGGEAA